MVIRFFVSTPISYFNQDGCLAGRQGIQKSAVQVISVSCRELY
ncbi:hypothetical protein [Aquiflexum lacus]|nr:hypothetical protein [Aquiflexum lacus]